MPTHPTTRASPRAGAAGAMATAAAHRPGAATTVTISSRWVGGVGAASGRLVCGLVRVLGTDGGGTSEQGAGPAGAGRQVWRRCGSSDAGPVTRARRRGGDQSIMRRWCTEDAGGILKES